MSRRSEAVFAFPLPLAVARALTGFSGPAIAAIAQLASAWLVADDENDVLTACALATMLETMRDDASRAAAWWVVCRAVGVRAAAELALQTGHVAQLATAARNARAQLGRALCCEAARLHDGGSNCVELSTFLAGMQSS